MANALSKAHSRWGNARLVEGTKREEGSFKIKPVAGPCTECPLKDGTCVPTERSEGALVAIVGEAPGQTELQTGRPFTGASGKLLSKLVFAIGLGRSDVIWSNAALCEVSNDKDLRLASKLCRDRLQSDLIGVTHVIPVGAYALQSVLKLSRKPRIMSYRGTIIEDGDRLVMPTVHPAFVLRSPLWEPVIVEDFERFARVMSQGWMPPERLQARKRVLVTSIDGLKRELADLEEVVSLDVETTEEPAIVNKLVCLGLTGVSGRRTIVIPWSKDMVGNGEYFGRGQSTAAELITDALSKRVAVTHNGPSFDHIVLHRHGIYVSDWDDTLLAHHVIASHMPQRLGHVVSMYMDVPPWKEQREETLTDLYRYNSQDALYTALTWKAMQPDLDRERDIYEIDCVSAELCRDMQMNGFRYDKAHSKVLSKHLEEEIKVANRKARRIVGEEVNLASAKQLRHAFFETLGAPVFFRSEKTGAPGLNVDALRAYAGYSDPKLRDLSNAVLAFRKAQKINGTYIKPIVLDEQDRIHPSWHCYGTVSGRFSCRQPNLMNLPRPENDPSIGLGGIRSLYIASKGHHLVCFDTAQLEMRIAAYVSGDENMIDACETDDLHSANASLLFGEEFDNAKGQERKMLRTIAKTSGFAIAYMAGAPAVYARIIAQGLTITMSQVEALLKKMKNKFATYYRYQDELLHQTMRLGYVQAPLSGRKRWVGHAPKPTEVSNHPIQSGAADHLNALLPKIADSIPYEAKLVAQIHDAAIFDTPERLVDEVKEIIQEKADEPVRVNGYDVVFPIELKVGDKWSEV